MLILVLIAVLIIARVGILGRLGTSGTIAVIALLVVPLWKYVAGNFVPGYMPASMRT